MSTSPYNETTCNDLLNILLSEIGCLVKCGNEGERFTKIRRHNKKNRILRKRYFSTHILKLPIQLKFFASEILLFNIKNLNNMAPKKLYCHIVVLYERSKMTNSVLKLIHTSQ